MPYKVVYLLHTPHSTLHTAIKIHCVYRILCLDEWMDGQMDGVGLELTGEFVGP